MGINERLTGLRKKMRENNIDMYYIPTNDFHGSEYISDYFQTRKYMSGFDGSSGTLIVTEESAGLWTDGRYFIQAEKQLAGTGITLYKSGMEGVISVSEYIKKNVNEGQTVGADGRMISHFFSVAMKSVLDKKKVKWDISKDLVGEIWTDRPAIEFKKAWLLTDEQAGESRKNKIKRLREWMQKREGDQVVVSALDDIAWLLNMRGDDIPCNPVVFSFLIVGKDKISLYISKDSLPESAKKELQDDGIEFFDYSNIYSIICNEVERVNTFVDKSTINARIVENFPKNWIIYEKTLPVTLWKSIKNPVEMENEREIHIKDGVAVTKFIFWLKQNIDKLPLTEMIAAEKLEKLRSDIPEYIEPSFDTIAGYAEHGAIVHYEATKETDKRLLPENFLLVDSGGQYTKGTTDITRTILLGREATAEQKKYYTAVLKGNLNLAAAKFKYGCSGVALDYLARKPLWDMGKDFNHGTGHGVGYILNVHEGPNNFRYKISANAYGDPILEEGMITSDEPGFYLEGQYGIRLENMLLCVKKEKTEYGQFMGFSELTLVPFERRAIEKALLNESERSLLNKYHEKVYDTLKDYLTNEEREWLADECAPI